MNKEILYGVAGLVLGVLITLFVTSNSSPVNNMMGQRQGMMTSQNSGVIDAHFIEQMIPHHDDAIAMAKIALTKATHEEIKTLANNVIISQSRENEQMQSWYKDWFGRVLPTGSEVMQQHGMMGNSGMHMGMMGGEQDLKALENAEEFDREFIEQMIPHHQMAVMMASMLKNGTQRSEMKKLADDIITAQTKEIEDMRKWYGEWGY